MWLWLQICYVWSLFCYSIWSVCYTNIDMDISDIFLRIFFFGIFKWILRNCKVFLWQTKFDDLYEHGNYDLTGLKIKLSIEIFHWVLNIQWIQINRQIISGSFQTLFGNKNPPSYVTHRILYPICIYCQICRNAQRMNLVRWWMIDVGVKTNKLIHIILTNCIVFYWLFSCHIWKSFAQLT